MVPGSGSISKLTSTYIGRAQQFSFTHAQVRVSFGQLLRYTIEPGSDAFLVVAKGEDGRSEIIAFIAGRGCNAQMDHANIDLSCVHTAHRRRGWAKSSMATFIETRSMPSSYCLEVRQSNDAAQSSYRNFGFCEQGVKPRFYTNEDALVMRLAHLAH